MKADEARALAAEKPREFEALVAEKIFGYEARLPELRYVVATWSTDNEVTAREGVCFPTPPMAGDKTRSAMIGEDGELDEMGRQVWYWEDNGERGDDGRFINGGRPVWPGYHYLSPSDFNPAIAVLHKMEESGFDSWSVNRMGHGEADKMPFWCTLYPPQGASVDGDYAETAQLAICLVALEAKGVIP